ncbi:MAG TPA: 16S rRNA (cytosine(1402)-N(4))-methyltransferase RsmH [Pseudomonadales bacterium]
MHVPVLLEEAVALLCGQGDDVDTARASADEGRVREGIYVDATFGRGGHTRRLLARLGPASAVIALDRDPAAVAAGRALAESEPRLTVRHGNFAELARILDELAIGSVQGVLMDLGVSSPQLDEPERGFSFRHDAPLDMRMDPSTGITAAEWLNEASEQEIARVLKEYGEERFARRVAAAIVAARPLATTADLVEAVRAGQPRQTPGKHDATRVFQAVRIQVNDELGALRRGLEAAFDRLAGGGRLAVISFHSLEDRAVKQFFRRQSTPPALPRRLPVRGDAGRAPGRLVGRPVKASAAEAAANPRARSARLRVLERVREDVA